MNNSTTFQGNGKVTYVPVVVNAKPHKQTNADRIRAMTDEELVKWIVCPHRGEIDLWTCSPSIKCDDCILDWLKQEAI